VTTTIDHATDAHWGAAAIDTSASDLPSLKARFLVRNTPERGRLCEIGSGDGKLLRTLRNQRPGLELHGCDIRVPTREADGYVFTKIEGERLPYDDASFDVVLVFDVLEHVPNPEGLLDEARRILRPGGKLVAFVPIQGEPVSFYSLYKALLGDDTYVITEEHIQSFTHAEVQEMLARRFDARETRYAYHFLGHLMDASFFAAARMEWLRRFWWKDNAYYNDEKKSGGLASNALNAALRLGNAAAFFESSLLQSVRATSAGLLYAGVRR
jgi:SAM-dependent methyltransferase